MVRLWIISRYVFDETSFLKIEIFSRPYFVSNPKWLHVDVLAPLLNKSPTKFVVRKLSIRRFASRRIFLWCVDLSLCTLNEVRMDGEGFRRLKRHEAYVVHWNKCDFLSTAVCAGGLLGIRVNPNSSASGYASLFLKTVPRPLFRWQDHSYFDQKTPVPSFVASTDT